MRSSEKAEEVVVVLDEVRNEASVPAVGLPHDLPAGLPTGVLHEQVARPAEAVHNEAEGMLVPVAAQLPVLDVRLSPHVVRQHVRQHVRQEVPHNAIEEREDLAVLRSMPNPRERAHHNAAGEPSALHEIIVRKLVNRQEAH